MPQKTSECPYIYTFPRFAHHRFLFWVKIQCKFRRFADPKILFFKLHDREFCTFAQLQHSLTLFLCENLRQIKRCFRVGILKNALCLSDFKGGKATFYRFAQNLSCKAGEISLYIYMSISIRIYVCNTELARF